MDRRLTPILGNSQKLDGGAMYGNCPREVWQRWTPPDEQGRIDLACRALLVQEDEQTLLLETGIGAFFPPNLRERYGVVEDHHVLLSSLSAAGVDHEDVDVVILSHLHFDHAGGLLSAYEEGRPPRLLFPHARFVVSRAAWDRARAPHPRDRASFIPELPDLLEATGRLDIVENGRIPGLGGDDRFHLSHGHTPGLLLTELATRYGPVVFAADLIPAAPWVHVPITMGYDRYPELLIDEKRGLLEDLLARDGCLFFTHDSKVAMGKVTCDEKGRFGVRPVDLS